MSSTARRSVPVAIPAPAVTMSQLQAQMATLVSMFAALPGAVAAPVGSPQTRASWGLASDAPVKRKRGRAKGECMRSTEPSDQLIGFSVTKTEKAMLDQMAQTEGYPRNRSRFLRSKLGFRG